MKKRLTLMFLLSLLFLLTGPFAIAQEKNKVLIVLHSDDIQQMKETEKVVEQFGSIHHIFPPHYMIGNIDKNQIDELLKHENIESIYTGKVNSSEVNVDDKNTPIVLSYWNKAFESETLSVKQIDSKILNDSEFLFDDVLVPSEFEDKIKLQSIKPLSAPSYYDTSSYMYGDVLVSIIFPESNGSIDPETENWTAAEKEEVINEIVDGLDWWIARAPAGVKLTFNYIVENDTPTSYEPINSANYNWIGEVLDHLGYSHTWQHYDYVNALRKNYGTDWAFTIFIADSSSYGDGTFRDGRFAFTVSPFMVMTLTLHGAGTANMGGVVAHETGHIFGASDQYIRLCDCTQKSGFLNVENQNCEKNCLIDEDSVMRGGLWGFWRNAVDYYARGQIGWRDLDNDSIIDCIDSTYNSWTDADENGIVDYWDCMPNWTKDTTPCLSNNSYLITYTDNNSCNKTYGLPADNGTYGFCDYCIPNWTCLDQGDQCQPNNQLNCNQVNDLNQCYQQTNLSSDLYQENYSKTNASSCDFCTPNWTCPSPGNECLSNDQFKCNQTNDTNQCYQKTNLSSDLYNGTFFEFNTSFCDFCTPDWTEILAECQPDESRIGWFNDTSNCYATTGLESDNVPPGNVTHYYSCDYDDDGFIGDISNVNTTLQDLNLFRDNNSLSFKDGNNTILMFENDFDSPLNFAELIIEKQPNDNLFGYIIIKGLDLRNQTKTIYVDKLASSTGICIKDEEISSITEMTDSCTGANEIWFACPGTNGQYSCNLFDNKFNVSGLSHSGVKEQKTYCGDGTCNGNEGCSSCSTDCGGCGGGSSSGGGGGSSSGGGGGSSKVQKEPEVIETAQTISVPLPRPKQKQPPEEQEAAKEENIEKNDLPELISDLSEEQTGNLPTGGAIAVFSKVKNNPWALSGIFIFVVLLTVIGCFVQGKKRKKQVKFK